MKAVPGPVTATDLWSLYTEAAACYEENGYTVIGPLPTVEGWDLGMDLGLPADPPFDESAVSDPCSKSLLPNKLRFASDATRNDRNVLATIRRSIIECVARKSPALAPTYRGADASEVLDLVRTEKRTDETALPVDDYLIAAGQHSNGTVRSCVLGVKAP